MDYSIHLLSPDLWFVWIGHVNIRIIFLWIGNSKWCLCNTQSKSDHLFYCNCKLIGCYRKIMEWQLFTLTCPIDQCIHYALITSLNTHLCCVTFTCRSISTTRCPKTITSTVRTLNNTEHNQCFPYYSLFHKHHSLIKQKGTYLKNKMLVSILFTFYVFYLHIMTKLLTFYHTNKRLEGEILICH